jgi:uncharacterized protein
VAQGAYRSASGVRTTAIAHVEATSAMVRMHKGQRISSTQLRSRLAELERLLQTAYVHATNDALLVKAAECARTHALRAYDAVHLAGALSFKEGEDLEFACWDRELRNAAGKHGFALIPEELPG